MTATAPTFTTLQTSYVAEKYQEKGVDVESTVKVYREPAMNHLKLFALRLALLFSSIALLLHALPLTFRGLGALVHSPQSHKDDACPQAPALTPAKYSSLLGSLENAFATTEFQSKAIESLGAAVRIP